MEAISVADVNAVEIPPIHDVGNWNSREAVAMSFVELMRMVETVNELSKLYQKYTKVMGIREVGLNFLTSKLNDLSNTIKLTYRYVNELKESGDLDRDPVLAQFSNKFSHASRIVKQFYDQNIRAFSSSSLKETPVEQFMKQVKALYETLLTAARRLIAFH